MLKNLLSLFAVALLWLLHFLPLAVLASLGSGLGRLLFLFGRERRKIVQINLGLCFPELDERAQNQLALAHFQVLGRSLLERSLLWWSPQKRVDRLIQVDGAEKISALLQAGKPVILLAPHFVGLDAGGVGIAMRFDSVSLYAEQSSPVFDHLLLKGRKRFGNQLLLSRQDGIRASIKAMKSGRPFYYLPDVSGRRRDSVFVPFFGVPTATVSAIPRLAPCWCHASPGCFREDKAIGSKLERPGRTTPPMTSRSMWRASMPASKRRSAPCPSSTYGCIGASRNSHTAPRRLTEDLSAEPIVPQHYARVCVPDYSGETNQGSF